MKKIIVELIELPKYGFSAGIDGNYIRPSIITYANSAGCYGRRDYIYIEVNSFTSEVSKYKVVLYKDKIQSKKKLHLFNKDIKDLITNEIVK